MGKKKYIIGGLMGVGKTYMMDRLKLIDEYAKEMDIQNEGLFIDISRKPDADFTKLIMDKFIYSDGQILDSCLLTHTITDSLIFNTQQYESIISKIKKALDESDINKDDYFIYIIEKPWSLNRSNIIERGRPYEQDMLNEGVINELVYNYFYTNAGYFYGELGFKNVYLAYTTTNGDAPEVDFIKYIESNGGLD